MSLPPATKLSRIPLSLDGEAISVVFQDVPSGGMQMVLKRAGHLTPLLTLNDNSRRVNRDEYFQLMGAVKK